MVCEGKKAGGHGVRSPAFTQAVFESLGSNFHAGPGSLTESGRRVRIRDRRRRPVRAFPAGREGPVFFQVMSLSLWTEFEHVVKLNGGL